MRKYTVLFLAFFYSFICNAQKADISHDQLYIVPEVYCVAGDVVGQFYVNCTDTVFNRRAGKYSYSILSGNTSNAFNIDASSGEISVASPSVIKYRSDYKLKVITKVDTDADTTYANIHVINKDSVYFIDPGFTGTENGSRVSPFNNWHLDIESGNRIKSGFTYLLKRGSVCLSGDYIYIANNSAKRVFIGAYGKGEIPVFDGRNSSTANGILVGGSWQCPLDASLMGRTITLMDIRVRGYMADSKNGIRLAPSSRDIQIHRLMIDGGSYNGCFYLGHSCDLSPQNILVQDCQAKHNPVSHLLKAEAGGVTLINFYGLDAPNGTGISFPVSPNDKASYFYINSKGESGINIRKENTHYNYGYITGPYRGVYLYNDNAAGLPYVGNAGLPYNSSLKNLIISNVYSYGIELEDGHNIVVDRVEVKNAGGPGIFIDADMDNVKVTNSRIHNNKNNGIEIKGNSTNITLSYNLIYRNTNGINVISAGNNLKIHGNTLAFNNTLDAVNTSGTQREFINNAFDKLNVTQWTSSNNYDIIDKTIFVNSDQGNFVPVKGCALIDKGKDLGYKVDFAGTPVPQNGIPDIGALEYSTGLTVVVPPPPVVDTTVVVVPPPPVVVQPPPVVVPPPPVVEPPVVTGPNQTIYYIDPDNKLDLQENGTIDHPFDSWEDVTWKSGCSYLQKCNTTADISSIIISASHVTLSSYGEGLKPVLNSSTDGYALKSFEKTNISIKNINVIANDAVSCLYVLGATTDSIVVEQCKFENADNAVRIVEGDEVYLRYNIFLNNDVAVYSVAKKTQLDYNVFVGSKIAVDGSRNQATVYLNNNVFYDNMQGLATTYSSVIAYNNVFYLVNKGDMALNCALKNVISDYNVFYPEQAGFIKVNNRLYNRLVDYQHVMKLDLHSMKLDPKFTDVYSLNFIPKAESPVINKGRWVGLAVDMIGNKVPSGGAPDIGIIEVPESVYLKGMQQSVAQDVHVQSESIIIYPNPSNGIIHLKAEETTEDKFQVKVSDLTGKIVYLRELIAGADKILDNIDLSDLPKGMYIVNLISEFANFSGLVTLY